MNITRRIFIASFSIPIIQTLLIIVVICKNIGIELNWFNKMFPYISKQLLDFKQALFTIFWVPYTIGTIIILLTILISVFVSLYKE